jgi:hypothetical protein
MKRFTLTQRLSAVFAMLLLACCGASAWLQIAANSRYEQEVVQRLSSGLAQHIAGTTELMDANGWKPDAVRSLFDMLMAVNPAVEVYLLSNDGRIVGDAAPAGQIKRAQVDRGRRPAQPGRPKGVQRCAGARGWAGKRLRLRGAARAGARRAGDGGVA